MTKDDFTHHSIDDTTADIKERLSVHDPKDKSGVMADLRKREELDGYSHWPEVIRCFNCLRTRPLSARGFTKKDRRWLGPNCAKRAVLRWEESSLPESYPGRGAYISDEAFRVAAVAAGMTPKDGMFLVRGDFWLLDPGEV